MKLAVLDGAILNPGDISWRPLEELGELTVHDKTSREDFAARVAGADIVLVNKTEVRKENITALESCRLVGVLATGANNLDLEELAGAGILACNVPAYGVMDVAQHAIALLLELARGTAAHTQSVRAGVWNKKGEWCYWLKPPLSLAGLTLGIIGFGAIGQETGRLGHALGMNVLANSRRREARPGYPFAWADVDRIWAESDVISLHCPLTPQTRHIINARSIAAMKEGAILLNTARGDLVDEKATAEALKSGKLGGLGADVLSTEPPLPDNPLLTSPNTLITPHMAWATAKARQKIIDITADNIRAFLAGKAANAINKPSLTK